MKLPPNVKWCRAAAEAGPQTLDFGREAYVIEVRRSDE